MAEAQGLPTVPRDAEHSKSSSIDEKLNEKSDSASVVQSVHGDVYDDVRDIDIGEDGKERPIGMSCIQLCYLTAVSHYFSPTQKPMSMSLPVSSPWKMTLLSRCSPSECGSLVLVFPASALFLGRSS